MKNLALRFRPQNLDELYEQDEVLQVFKKFLAAKNLPNSIFYGESGVGKTSFARILAKELSYDFYEFNGGNFSINELRKILNIYENSLTKALIFIDEIHRLSKNQQDALLLPLENKKALFFGASTENPSFVLTKALNSRLLTFEFKPLANFEKILSRVQKELSFEIDEEAKEYLFKSSNFDARAMLNLLEFALVLDKKISLKNLKILRQSSLSESVVSDEKHYNLISAFIKSIRGSDVDAGLYYLARMIKASESADFIARRLVILASEDIGNANPNALNIAVNTLEAVKNIGFPEARIILAQAVVYLASSPKTNSSYLAIDKALAFVEKEEEKALPKHLINQSSAYIYPHDFGGFVEQKYKNNDELFYESKKIAFEKTLDDWREKIKKKEI